MLQLRFHLFGCFLEQAGNPSRHEINVSGIDLQETGYLVKNPSIFLKKVAFVRKYEIRDGISVPRQVLSVVETRLVGTAELTIDFTNFSVDPSKPAVAEVLAQ